MAEAIPRMIPTQCINNIIDATKLIWNIHSILYCFQSYIFSDGFQEFFIIDNIKWVFFKPEEAYL